MPFLFANENASLVGDDVNPVYTIAQLERFIDLSVGEQGEKKVSIRKSRVWIRSPPEPDFHPLEVDCRLAAAGLDPGLDFHGPLAFDQFSD